MPLSYRELNSPKAEPVTLDQAKRQCRIDPGYTDEDDLLSGYIVAARQTCEGFMGRNIFNRSMVMTLDYFPWPGWETVLGNTVDSYLATYFRGLSIRLPKAAVASVEGVSYIDNSGTTQTLDPGTYKTDLVSEPARIMPAPGFTWPYQNQYIPGQVQILFTSGTFGDGTEATKCPQAIVLAILLLVGHFYNNREASTVEAGLKTLPLGIAELLSPYTFETMR